MLPFSGESDKSIKLSEELFHFCDQDDMLTENCCKDCVS